MKKIILRISERGRFVNIPGMPSFRTPAEIDISRIPVQTVIQSLHLCGVEKYNIVSDDIVQKTTDLKTHIPEIPRRNKRDNNDELIEKFDKKFSRIESMLQKLAFEKYSRKDLSQEQINEHLRRIEKYLKNGGTVRVSKEVTPKIDELDETFIPEIDTNDLKLSGMTTEVLEKKSEKDIDDAADLLSSLSK